MLDPYILTRLGIVPCTHKCTSLLFRFVCKVSLLFSDLLTMQRRGHGPRACHVSVHRACAYGVPTPRPCNFSLKTQDPGSGRKIPAKWYGTGACHGVFIPETREYSGYKLILSVYIFTVKTFQPSRDLCYWRYYVGISMSVLGSLLAGICWKFISRVNMDTML